MVCNTHSICEHGCSQHLQPEQPFTLGHTRLLLHQMHPETQQAALHSDGQCCCRTGDIAEASGDPPYYALLGRASADIIKSAGYKMSALRIENVIAAHPHVREVAVLGMPHDTLGEEITAVVACHEPHEVSICVPILVLPWRCMLHVPNSRGVQQP